MTQNYYLYNNPDNGLLTWIPWDNNEALQERENRVDLLHWTFLICHPEAGRVIEYLYDDEVYRSKYDQYVKETIEGPFESQCHPIRLCRRIQPH